MAERSFTHRRLEGIVEDALREAGVLGVLPTPLDAVRRVAGVRAVEPMQRLPAEIAAVRERLLGALWFQERTIFVDEQQSEPRRRFTEAHELAHALCPWHEAALRLDTEDELFRPVAEAIEAEANVAAGMLLFQGGSFAVRAGADPPTIELAHALAREHGASLHATLRHLVETHACPAALLATGRFPARDGTLPVWLDTRSAAFSARFGHGRRAALHPGTAIHELAEASRTAGHARGKIRLRDSSGRRRTCAAESYYNRHTFLVLITAPRRGR
jgi:uncharacterized protein DUF955